MNPLFKGIPDPPGKYVEDPPPSEEEIRRIEVYTYNECTCGQAPGFFHNTGCAKYKKYTKEEWDKLKVLL